MILIVETARELIETLAIEIQTLEEELKNQDSVLEAKKQLEMVNQELDSFDAYLTKRKSDKLRKDIRWFTQEKAYPYLSDKYYQNYNQTGQSADRQFWTSKKIVTFSDTSESEVEGTSDRLEQSDNRSSYHDGFNQSNRFLSRRGSQRTRFRGQQRGRYYNTDTPTHFLQTRRQQYGRD
ncbi:hypothetical protein NDU88_006513 [Pleurodeles waltl]|uniref:Uncharacterized protein n=1 Tax=Pleurodeles waltl TaxID=8319 RepID=A0AAV7UMC5_PLEWA|nr:hypothetical protein NDU88_006513 [Pleurodeles waltl]